MANYDEYGFITELDKNEIFVFQSPFTKERPISFKSFPSQTKNAPIALKMFTKNPIKPFGIPTKNFFNL